MKNSIVILFIIISSCSYSQKKIEPLINANFFPLKIYQDTIIKFQNGSYAKYEENNGTMFIKSFDPDSAVIVFISSQMYP